MSTDVEIAMWGALIIFNASIIRLLGVSFSKISFRDVLREKDPSANAAAAKAVAASPAAAGGVAPPAAGASAAAATTIVPPDDTSYSRVAGLLGAVVIGCFVWGLGNVVLFKAFTAPGDIDALLKGVSSFLLSSSALFAPYAFNQLKDTFRPTAPR
jgi:hypothetical protein